MQETFVTVLKNSQAQRQIRIDNIAYYLQLEDKEVDVDYTAQVKVHWTFGIDDAREWGIKDLIFRVDKVEVDIDWSYTVYDDKDNEIDNKNGNIEALFTNDYHKDNNPEGFEIKNEMKLSLSTICPEYIEIDFHENTINVS